MAFSEPGCAITAAKLQRIFPSQATRPPHHPACPYIFEVSQQAPETIRIIDYLDYRAFLKDAYREKRKRNTAFSCRYLAGKVGSDSGTLSRILRSQRHLDPRMANSLARAYGLQDFEREYFETLVLFGQATTHIEKNIFLEKLLNLRGSTVKTLEERQFQFYRKWFYPAMRELFNILPFDGNYQKLARTLRPPITVQEAKEAVKLIQDLGLVEKDKEGALRPTEKLITSGDNVRAVFMTNLQSAMAELSARAIHEVEPAERDFSGLTLSLSTEGFRQIKEKIKQIRRQILEQAAKDPKAERVYRLNLQFFPLSYDAPSEQA